jgi:nucleoside-diphosphate kinase
LSKKHYAEHVSKPFYPTLEAFITGGPIVALVLEGLEVIRVVRDMLGATSGLKAAAGTIRGGYSSSRQMNLVHASDGPEASAREIGLYFAAGRVRYERGVRHWAAYCAAFNGCSTEWQVNASISFTVQAICLHERGLKSLSNSAFRTLAHTLPTTVHRAI